MGRIRSANAEAWKWSIGHFSPAGAIYLSDGRIRMAPDIAQRRAGSVIDLWKARAHRLSGNKLLARAYLDFARDARLCLAPGPHRS